MALYIQTVVVWDFWTINNVSMDASKAALSFNSPDHFVAVNHGKLSGQIIATNPPSGHVEKGGFVRESPSKSRKKINFRNYRIIWPEFYPIILNLSDSHWFLKQYPPFKLNFKVWSSQFQEASGRQRSELGYRRTSTFPSMEKMEKAGGGEGWKQGERRWSFKRWAKNLFVPQGHWFNKKDLGFNNKTNRFPRKTSMVGRYCRFPIEIVPFSGDMLVYAVVTFYEHDTFADEECLYFQSPCFKTKPLQIQWEYLNVIAENGSYLRMTSSIL